jgi:hypothetical protein
MGVWCGISLTLNSLSLSLSVRCKLHSYFSPLVLNDIKRKPDSIIARKKSVSIGFFAFFLLNPGGGIIYFAIES